MVELKKISLPVGKEFEKFLRKYLIDHSGRRLNYLYWNVTDAKEMALHFINLAGRELGRVNNSDLIYRAVRIKNSSDWAILSKFINDHIVDPETPKAAYVIRVDYLVTYMKSIKFDVTKMVLTRGMFGTVFIHDDDLDEKKRQPLCTIDTDVQSLFLVDELYTKYRKLLYSNSDDWEIKNILDDYLSNESFNYVIDDLRVTLPALESLDIVTRKFVGERMKEDGCSLEQIYLKNGMSTVSSRFTCPDMTIVSVRVYIQIFLRKYAKKGKADGTK